MADDGCGETIRELETFLDDELSDEPRAQIHDHLEGCVDCLQAFDFQAELKASSPQVQQRRDAARPAGQDRTLLRHRLRRRRHHRRTRLGRSRRASPAGARPRPVGARLLAVPLASRVSHPRARCQRPRGTCELETSTKGPTNDDHRTTDR